MVRQLSRSHAQRLTPETNCDSLQVEAARHLASRSWLYLIYEVRNAQIQQFRNRRGLTAHSHTKFQRSRTLCARQSYCDLNMSNL